MPASYEAAMAAEAQLRWSYPKEGLYTLSQRTPKTIGI